LPKRPLASIPDVIGLGSVIAIPALSQARISSPLLLRHHLSTSSPNSSATLSLARCSASRHFPITRSWFGFRPVSGRPND
jgi:hypothetical protein